MPSEKLTIPGCETAVKDKPGEKNAWTCVYALDRERRRLSGDVNELVAAVRRGADLRIYTEFRHNEHIDTASTNRELIHEVADFRVTYVLEERWVAGIMNMRQPIELPHGLGPRPSMSLFLYNQDGQQAIARPFLDGRTGTGDGAAPPPHVLSSMPKYHLQDTWGTGTNAPSSNFIYDFESYRFWVSDDWTEKLAHTADGTVLSGSIEALIDAFHQGREVKVGIRGLCNDFGEGAMDHEVFIHCGSCYCYTDQKLFMAGSHPVVRVRPAIPLRYTSKGWDFGWLMPRTDGFAARWLVNPYTLKFHQSTGRYAIRWFVR